MSEMQETGTGGVTLSHDVLMPSVQRIGGREIEITFLGRNAQGQLTWILWNASDPYLIGMLCQGKMGFNFEQRTTSGVMLHENITLNRVQRALGG